MGAIFRRELGSYFTSSIAYVFLTCFYLGAGYMFFDGTFASGTASVSVFFSSLLLIVIILIPILTMKTFSEEKKQKTEQGLLTAPISLTSMVMGKYFAVLLVYLCGISIVFVYSLILSIFGTVDWIMVVSYYAALVLLGAAFIAICVFISSLTENQAVAAVAGIVTLIFLYMLDYIASNVDFDFISNALYAISFSKKYYEFTCGLFNLSSVIFYISIAVVFNFLTVRVFETRRWR